MDHPKGPPTCWYAKNHTVDHHFGGVVVVDDDNDDDNDDGYDGFSTEHHWDAESHGSS